MPGVTSSRAGSAPAQLTVIVTEGADWEGPFSPRAQLGPQACTWTPHACLVFTGLKLPPFGTLWDLVYFHFCSQLSGLHGPHLQVSACPSPMMQPREALPTSHTPLWPLFSSAGLPVLCLASDKLFGPT